MTMNDTHTAYPESFGLLYGKTTKTACDKRQLTSELVSRDAASCVECKAAWVRWDAEQDQIRAAAMAVANADGYESIEAWIDAHPRRRHPGKGSR